MAIIDHAAHGHAHDHAAGEGGNRRRVLLAAVLTCGFMVAEAVGGLLTGSLALLADAGHMLTDSVALVLAYVAYRVSERPRHEPHDLWLRPAEDPRRLHERPDRARHRALDRRRGGRSASWRPRRSSAAPMLAIAAAGLLVNVVVFAILHGGDRESLNLRGAILHVLGDLLGSVAAIVGGADHPDDRLAAGRSAAVRAGGAAPRRQRLAADARIRADPARGGAARMSTATRVADDLAAQRRGRGRHPSHACLEP